MTSDNLILFNTAEQLSSRKHWTAFSIHPFSKALVLYRVAGFFSSYPSVLGCRQKKYPGPTTIWIVYNLFQICYYCK